MRTDNQFDPIFGQAPRAGINGANADGNGRSDSGNDTNGRGFLYDGWSYQPLPPARDDRPRLLPPVVR
ncbi:hypothetical protein [Sphingomonas sp. TZW2008]|uniref:hypothetical protein n=1 Tax=Sphingomonas sp. TZW2008 TaxID=1917973 RepID=UPI000A272019|nr:hypothetical protein [Sphingomonas sp. TZW2008]